MFHFIIKEYLYTATNGVSLREIIVLKRKIRRIKENIYEKNVHCLHQRHKLTDR